ncbi:MAG: protein kinase [Pseudonocardia sp.]
MREFGQYRIESLIGFGGMGEVHRAYDTRRDREVALKLLPTALSRDPEYQKRFRRESYTVARLREPHVIPIHDYGEIDDQLFIDMRLVDGRSLGAMLSEDGALDQTRAVALVVQVADALDAAHADGLVHRDIKPSNILVTPNDFVYVVDFGIAHVTGHTHSALTMSGATLGTLDYMAPERFESRPVDPRTDVYSLACVLYECLTAQRPFAGNDLPALMYGHLFSDPPKPSAVNPAVHPAFDDVVARGMAKNMEERFTGARQFADAARAALATAQVAAHTGAVPTPVVTPAGPEAEPTVLNAGEATILNAGEATVRDAQYPGDAAQVHPAFAAPPYGNGHGGGYGNNGAGYGGGPGYGPGGPPGHYTQGVAVADPPPPGGPAAPPTTSGGGGSRKLIYGLAAVALVAVLVAATTIVLLLRGDSPASGLGPIAAPPAKVKAANSIDKPTVAGDPVPVGPTPGYMEITPDGSRGYIANRGAGVLTVFDTTRNQVLGTIPVPDGSPQFVAFTPDGTRAYVSVTNADFTVNEVVVVDTASFQILDKIPTGKRPFALDITPDGKTVYVPNHDSGSITVIDTATDKVTDEIKVAPNPHWVDVTEDGKYVWAANHESNVVSVIDTGTNQVLATVPVGASPHSIVKLPGKDTVIVCNYDGNSLSVIDTKTNKVTKTIATGNHPQDITLSADGKHAYIATVDDNAIQVVNLDRLEITDSVPTGDSPTSVAVGPEGRQAYVTNLNDGTVTVVNIAGTA